MKTNKIEIETPLGYFSRGLTTAGLLSAVLLAGHVFGSLTWWALPITIALAASSFGFEISPRPKPRNLNL